MFVALPIGRTCFSVVCAMVVGLVTAAVARGQSGELDETFGAAGLATTDFGGAFDRVEGLVEMPDGKLVAVGTAGSSNRYGVARYHPDGSPDMSFSGDGQLIMPASLGTSGGVAAGPNGTILIGCGYIQNSAQRHMIGRLLDNGDFDLSFGTAGLTVFAAGEQPYVAAILLQEDGKAVMAGYSYTSGAWDWVLFRVDAGGMPDSGFGTGGIVRTDFSREEIAGPIDFLVSLALQPDGKIIAGGLTSTTSQMSSGNRIHALARYHPNGELDDTFGDGGKVVFTFGPDPFYAENVSKIAVLKDGKLLLASAGGGRTILVRLNEDGSLDETWASGGRVVGPQGGFYNDPTDFVIDGGGRIVCNGRGFSLTRFLDDGNTDMSFGEDGGLSTPFGTSYEFSSAMVRTQTNRVVLGGFIGTANVNTNFALARYHVVPVTDYDDDSIPNELDNCPEHPNTGQEDFDTDGAGDPCDPDTDDDGVANAHDICRFTPLEAPVRDDGTLRADADGDCDVDLADFQIMQSEFGMPALQP